MTLLCHWLIRLLSDVEENLGPTINEIIEQSQHISSEINFSQGKIKFENNAGKQYVTNVTKSILYKKC